MIRKQLTQKQERFCREYVLCMNASEAYRRAYDAENMKPETIWKRSSEILKGGAVKGRVETLKKDIEGTLEINKLTQIKDLIRIKIKAEDTADYSNATKAIAQISKMMGYDAPTKIEGSITLGSILDELKKE